MVPLAGTQRTSGAGVPYIYCTQYEHRKRGNFALTGLYKKAVRDMPRDKISIYL